MRKSILFFILFAIAFMSCSKEEEVSVEYRISNGYGNTYIWYQLEDNVRAAELDFESAEDVTIFNLTALAGEIVYLSASYPDSASSITLEILLDGKVFKEATSQNKPNEYLTISGTIPF